MVLSVAGCAKIDDGSNAETAGNVAVEHIEQDLLAQRRKSGHCKRQATYWFKKSAEQGGNIILSMCRAECI